MATDRPEATGGVGPHFVGDKIDKISKLIASIGGSIVNLPQVSENGTHKVMYCHDIDGIIVELVQEL